MVSKINYIVAITLIILNLILLPINISLIKDGFPPFGKEINITTFLTIGSFFIITAILAFLRKFNQNIFILILNSIGLMLSAFFIYAGFGSSFY
jgi:hypothetical protein